jgi:hypothetical protein
MLKTTRTGKMAAAEASASTNKVKNEQGSDGAWSSPLCGKKRSLDEADGKEGEGRPPSLVVKTPPSAHGCSSSAAEDSGFMSPLCGKKRSLDEADGKEGEGRPPSVVLDTPLSAHGCSFPPAEDSGLMGILKVC